MNMLKVSLQKLSKAQWFSYIESWEKSGKPQAQFCEENNLSYSIFGYWRTAYLKEKVVPEVHDSKTKEASLVKSSPPFIPVNPATSKLPAMSEMIQARYPSGLMLNLPSSLPTEKMINLLHGLEQAYAN